MFNDQIFENYIFDQILLNNIMANQYRELVSLAAEIKNRMKK
jgi:hypothetical protein